MPAKRFPETVYFDPAKVPDKCKTTDVDKGMPGNYSGRCPAWIDRYNGNYTGGVEAPVVRSS